MSYLLRRPLPPKLRIQSTLHSKVNTARATDQRSRAVKAANQASNKLVTERTDAVLELFGAARIPVGILAGDGVLAGEGNVEDIFIVMTAIGIVLLAKAQISRSETRLADQGLAIVAVGVTPDTVHKTVVADHRHNTQGLYADLARIKGGVVVAFVAENDVSNLKVNS